MRLLLIVLFLLSLAASAADSSLVGKAAPDFALRATNGPNQRLSEFAGDVVLISFWASRCNTCRDQLRSLDALHRTYANAGLVVVGIGVEDDDGKAREFAASQPVGFPMLLDPQKTVARSYRIESLPTVIAVDRGGVVRYVSRDGSGKTQPDYLGVLRTLLDE
ncbi:MAG: TlpA disulfide reductase family protein [Steroidobacteraceae bacterium]